MRVMATLFALLLLPSTTAATSPAARLAAAFADAIVGAAQARPVELALPEDRTSRGAAFALDLRALVAAHLEGRLTLADSGPRLRVAWVVSQTPHRLVASARIVEEPEGRLVDLLSASEELEDGLLTLASERPPAAGRALDVVSATRTPALDGSVMDLAFIDDERLVVLFPDAVALYRWEGTALVQESRQALPGPLAAVRCPGGLLALAPREGALWAMTSRSPKAVLFGVEGRRLVRRHDAAALPWPGCLGGLRYRPGTNLIEGNVAALGPGPFLAIAAEGDMAVLPDGRLRVAAPAEVDAPALRVGPALAPLFKGLLAAPSAEAPGRSDAILVLSAESGLLAALGAAPGLRIVETLPVDGSVRSLAARTRGEGARLAAAVDEPGGGTHLLLLELRRREMREP